MTIEQLDIKNHILENTFHNSEKNNFRLIIGLNMKAKTVQLIGEKKGEYLYAFGIGNFFTLDTKNRNHKINGKLNLIKIVICAYNKTLLRK